MSWYPDIATFGAPGQSNRVSISRQLNWQAIVRRHLQPPTHPGRKDLIVVLRILQEADAFKTAPYNGNRSVLAARIDDQYLTDVVPRFFASELPQPVNRLVLPWLQRHSLDMHSLSCGRYACLGSVKIPTSSVGPANEKQTAASYEPFTAI